MQITSALTSAVSGIKKGLDGMDKNAAEIASAENFNSENPADTAQSLVEMKTHRMQIEASAQVIKSVDETLGSLIDVMA